MADSSPEGYKRGKPDVEWWLTQIKLGESFRRKALMEDQWDMWRNYYRGKWRRDILPSNLFFKMLRTVVPRIYFRNPSVSIVNRQPGIENYILSALLERTHNKLLRTMGVKKSMKSQVQSSFQWGAGVGKLGFGAEFTPTPQNLGIITAPTVGKGLEQRVEYSNFVEPNFPWYKHAPTNSYILPAGTRVKEDARWEAFFFKRPLQDVIDDPRMENTKQLKDKSTRMHGRVDEFTKPEENKGYDEIEMYEVRDKKTGKVFIISPSMTDDVLLFKDDVFTNLGISNAYMLVFNEDDEWAWGTPDSQILDPLQREINEIRTYEMYHRRLSIVKILAKRGSISEDEAAKLLSPDVNAISWVDDNSLQDAIKIIEASGIPDSLIAMDNIVSNEVRETVGFSRNEFGEFRPGSRAASATEAAIVKQASDIRVEERRDMVADLITDLVKGINPLLFEHWTKEEVVEMVGPGGIPIWVAFTPQMLDRKIFEVNVDPDTSLPQTKDIREEKAMKMYQLLRQEPLIDPTRLLRYTLHELHGVAFDDMMRILPGGAGLNQEQPLTPNQFGQVLQNTSQQFPQLVTPQGANGGGVPDETPTEGPNANL